ncbi:MAG TPA: hypothetical protein PKE64_26670 [Anaerolineae bacterium]|nr:hypothetical protein [Anaerolineae bacterium]
MDKFNQLLQQVVQPNDASLEFKPRQTGLEVRFRNGRHQVIEVDRRNEHYVMTSPVLGKHEVEKIGRSRVLARLWQRNRETNVVAFSLDKQGQLVGQIEQLAATIDQEELVFYLELLARECDQFEYALTGEDNM